ncbi:copper chaperone PCu(A)C [Neptuniibacter sp.]|uniref:copper chaperone PCu(A)C n=1 Tax=Neptuniibacter sp. TaxID=1962643 RepID=UPI0026215754|nr:copper chaperone PCu(A)C [Neptuniibacter sp.]MCP4596258.1 copper chaperone PCu(A)C [Neptuniibacter sp.]
MIKSLLKQSCILATLSLSSIALAEVSVEDAYARAVPPGQMITASFMTLKNTDDNEVALVAAESSAAKAVELHNHINQDGVMKMRKVEQINVPAAGSTVLKPGGLHVMLIGLHNDLTEGQEIDLTLKFSDGSTQTLTVPVKKAMDGMKGHSHGGGHHHH